MRSRRRSIAAALAVAAAGVAAALVPATALASKAGSQRVAEGQVVATVSWKASHQGSFGVRAPRLRIERAGVLALDAGIGDLCDRCEFFGDEKAPNVELADLDGDGELEVLVTAFTGGAHCCTDLGVWDFRPVPRTYGHLIRNFGNGGFSVRDLDQDGQPELSSVDDRFAYAFAPYVFSARPPQVLRWRRTPKAGLVDVTREFPAEIRRDAGELRQTLRSRSRSSAEIDLRGPLAAYVADMYLLGRGTEGLAEIDRVQRRGRLGSTSDGIWPGGKRFRPALLTFLRRTGYR